MQLKISCESAATDCHAPPVVTPRQMPKGGDAAAGEEEPKERRSHNYEEFPQLPGLPGQLALPITPLEVQKSYSERSELRDDHPLGDWRRLASSRSDLEQDGSGVSRDPWVLTPQNNPFLQFWDLGTMTALTFVALVTPAEVALLETQLDALFCINRIIDFIFVVDMGLQFCVAYHVKTPFGTRLEARQNIIVRHYLRTWFPLDVLSILPFDSLGMIAESGALKRAKLMRIFRLLRLIKLVRVLRASRLFHRWETSLAINYNTLKLVCAFLVFLLASHWVACCWAMLAIQGDPEANSWLQHSRPAAEEGMPATPLEVYISALYWSTMTVTSVGYGDIVPVTNSERLFCALLMMLSGFLWAYALGETMAALGNSNIHEKAFRQMLDDLNHMMADRGLSNNLQRRLRAFFFQIKDLARIQGYKKLIDKLSPSLQGELAMTMNDVWLQKVWYFNSDSLPMPPTFMSNVATSLQVSVHAQQECIGEPWTLFILHRGLCVRRMNILRSGAVWGEEFILTSRELLDRTPSFSLTFIELSRLTRARFVDVLKRYPEVWKPVRGAVVRTAARRGILREAKRRLGSQGLRPAGNAKSKVFMGFADRIPRITSVELVGAASGFPMGIQDDGDVGERLQELSAKQENLQRQLESTRSLLSQQLGRIEDQLKLLLPRN